MLKKRPRYSVFRFLDDSLCTTTPQPLPNGQKTEKGKIKKKKNTRLVRSVRPRLVLQRAYLPITPQTVTDLESSRAGTFFGRKMEICPIVDFRALK